MESLKIYRAAVDVDPADKKTGSIVALGNLASIDGRTGRPAEAESLLKEALQISRDLTKERSWGVYWETSTLNQLRINVYQK